MNKNNIAQNWQKRGFSCDIWTDPPGQIWKDYCHNEDELFMVIDGQVILEMNGQALHLKPNEEILIPAGILHTVKNVGNTHSHWYYGYRN